jgi:hypothetical protein
MAELEGMYIQGQNVTNIMTYVLNRMACSIAYDSWSNEFCRKENKDALDRAIEEIRKIDFTQITEKEAEILGFRKFDEESYLYLIPLWIYDALPNGIELTSILGIRAIKGTDYVDNDVRMGCMGYGIVIRPAEQVYKSDTIRLDEMEDESNNE